MKYIIALIIGGLLISCEYKNNESHHYYIRFKNESNRSIYIAESEYYPDTFCLLENRAKYVSKYPFPYKVLPGAINDDAFFTTTPWEFSFGNENCLPSDTLIIYVYDGDLIEKGDFDSEHKYMLARYDLSLADLQHVNWLLTYPPSENMRDIKMWPYYNSK
ncbi:MAG: hypothetical protein IKP63_07770 [Paludibacteraceae bacterium]|nr:hypothetical protein [Paludibacteraceae bacterium]